MDDTSKVTESEKVVDKPRVGPGKKANPLTNFFLDRKNIIIPGLIVLALLLIIPSLYLKFIGNKNKALFFQNATSLNTTENGVGDVNYKINFDFAKYNLINTPFKPSLPEYQISIPDLYNITNFEQSLKKQFTDNQKAAIAGENFFITQNLDKFWNDDPDSVSQRNDDWTSLYARIGGGAIWERAPENSVFITSDFLLHVYHKLLEKEFEYLENKKLYPALKEITDSVLNKAIKDYSNQSNPENKASYERIIAFFAVPKAILDAAFDEMAQDTTVDQKVDTNENILKNLDDLKSRIPAYSYTKAKAEINLILASATISPSPLFDEFLSAAGLVNPQDYTQFTPRSHYNKNSILRSYFRAMMWYGRSNFALKSTELTRDGINISLLTKNSGQLKNWESIYIPTAFLVGKSDDLGIYEYNTSLSKLGDKSIDKNTVAKIQEDMKNYQGPQIMSSVLVGNDVFGSSKGELVNKTKGFRFMGQRFTPDAFIFTSLTQGDEAPDPVTGQRLPSSTTALMVMSVMGNKTADPMVLNWISANAPESDRVLGNNLAALKDKFSKISTDIWTQNIYWGWLYTIKSLYTGDINKSGYPMFVKNDSWNLKNLQASLGSWTELKHDTLLYAKQSYSEMGGGGEPPTPPPVPKGYVEPNIPFFDRLIALAQMTEDGLKSRDLINGIFVSRSNSFIKSLNFFKAMAVKELQNETISDDDFEKLRTEAGYMSFILSALPGEEAHEKDARSALIADVQTDIKKNQILYEADGIPNYIYVAVKDANGTRLTKGLVFNYYEFNTPIGKRLTDQDWWAVNYTQDKSLLPAIPDWSQSLYK
ncbi:MAG: DUF3160 domain-containing protein [Candidatus Woesebacteria bacterium]|nr:MAG: DUF3160 domain-containing protein [Candidatus Woesebacteria bacterium]